MFSERRKVKVAVIASALLVSGGLLGSAAAQKASVPRVQDKLALGEEQVRQLLLLMEADKQGKVSKQEYMKFMESEFERLDKDKSGALNVKEITRPAVASNHFVGK